VKRLVLIALFLAVFVAPAQAAPKGIYICDGTPSGNWPSVTPQLIDSNVLVPAGGSCSLYESEVTGNVVVEGQLGGFGDTFDRNVIVNGGQVGFPNPIFAHGMGESHVLGNLLINTTSFLTLSVRVDGNLSLEGATSADFTLVATGGNVSVKNSANVLFFASDSIEGPGIGGNLSLVGNTNVSISFTSIGGILDCEANDPAPVLGNRVTARKATGQCAL
jgi:hypothetical protein